MSVLGYDTGAGGRGRGLGKASGFAPNPIHWLLISESAAHHHHQHHTGGVAKAGSGIHNNILQNTESKPKSYKLDRTSHLSIFRINFKICLKTEGVRKKKNSLTETLRHLVIVKIVVNS